LLKENEELKAKEKLSTDQFLDKLMIPLEQYWFKIKQGIEQLKKEEQNNSTISTNITNDNNISVDDSPEELFVFQDIDTKDVHIISKQATKFPPFKDMNLVIVISNTSSKIGVEE